MIEEQLSVLPSFRSVLTPRQDRFEERLVRAVANAGPRSAIRDAVHHLADHLRLQGIPASRGLAIVMEVASRGSRSTDDVAWREHRGVGAPLDSLDVLTLVSQWAAARFGRAD